MANIGWYTSSEEIVRDRTTSPFAFTLTMSLVMTSSRIAICWAGPECLSLLRIANVFQSVILMPRQVHKSHSITQDELAANPGLHLHRGLKSTSGVSATLPLLWLWCRRCWCRWCWCFCHCCCESKWMSQSLETSSLVVVMSSSVPLLSMSLLLTEL